MPIATVRANVQAIPNRRTALTALTGAGALFLAPRAARAEGDDAALFAQVARIVAMHAAAQPLARGAGEAGELAFGNAIDALTVAQSDLMKMQPQTFAGLQAMAAALLASDAFGQEGMAADLAQTIVDMPAPAEASL